MHPVKARFLSFLRKSGLGKFMEDQVLLLIEIVRESLLVQAILLVALSLAAFAVLKEIRLVQGRHRQEKAIFAPPLLSAKEAFPDGYLQSKKRGMWRRDKDTKPLFIGIPTEHEYEN